MNILLVFTGGTIGSISQKGIINTSDKQGYQLVSLFQQHSADAQNINFTCIQPLQILSENLFPADWEDLINAIEAEDISQYDGIIITHGTDTLAYTAAALSFYFNATSIPVLVVSSDFPLDHPSANGLHHFNCAIEFIKQRKQAGVFVPYRNQGSATLVHLGARLSSSLQLTGDFMSVQSKAFLKFEKNTFKPLNSINLSNCKQIQLKALFSSRVLLIKPYPGLDYSHFLLDQVDVVIHDLYHSGTACSSNRWGENHSLMPFVRLCKQKGISLYMAPAIQNHDAYKSTHLLIEQGAKMIWDMSIEAAYVKLLLGYGNFKTSFSIEQFLEQNIAFEKI